jgi:hypothetical protein
MKKIILLLLISLLSFFSYLYISRDPVIHIYRTLSNEYINYKEDFSIYLFSNYKESIYTNISKISLEINDLKLKVKKINVNKYEDIYKIEYVINKTDDYKGLYEDLKLKLKYDNVVKEVTLGDYYFKNTNLSEINYKVEYDALGNSKYAIFDIPFKELSINGVKCLKDLNEKKIPIKSNYTNKNLLFETDKSNFLVKNKTVENLKEF